MIVRSCESISCEGQSKHEYHPPTTFSTKRFLAKSVYPQFSSSGTKGGPPLVESVITIWAEGPLLLPLDPVVVSGSRAPDTHDVAHISLDLIRFDEGEITPWEVIILLDPF